MRKNSDKSLHEGGLSHYRVRAFTLSREIGKRIAKDYPQIASDYMSGETQREITEKYCFTEKYNLREKIAKNAVYFALKELISGEKLSRLEEEHRTLSRKAVCAAGMGIGSMTLKQRRKAGGKGGTKTYELGVGIHTLTSEQKSAVGRKGGRAATLSKGLTPWSNEEKIYFLELCKNPEYQHSSGARIGCPNYKHIAQNLKATFGTERTPNSMNMVNWLVRTGQMDKPETKEVG